MNYQNSNESMHGAGTVFAFACGAIAGTAIALLFAPTTGRDTRAFLTQRGRRAADKGRELLTEQGSRIAEVVERGRDKALVFGERLGHAVEQGKAGYRDALRQGQELVADATKNAEDAVRAVRGTGPHAAE